MVKRNSKKYTYEKINEAVKDLGYLLLESYHGENSKLRVVVQDKIGYKFDMDFYNLLNNNGKARLVDKSNPFTISNNIPLWLFLNRYEFELCDNNVYTGAHGKMSFYHYDCGEIFYSSWTDVSQGKGCGICYGKQIGKNNNLFSQKPEIAKEWHYDNVESPEEVTVFSHKKVYWICSKCGYGKNKEWKTSIYHRSNGTSCPSCAGHVVSDKNRLSILFPEVALEWHPIKNGELTPNDVSYGESRKVWWKCGECEKEWSSLVNSRSSGVGCPNCSSSKLEKRIGAFLKKYKLEYSCQYRILECRSKNPLPFDFAVWKNKRLILIEAQGIQHYKKEKRGWFSSDEVINKIKRHDEIKQKYCEDNNIELVIIPYWEFDNIEKILKETFKEVSFV